MLAAGGGAGPDQFVYSAPDVDMSACDRVGEIWSAEENVYNWTYLDRVTARAAAAGKPLLVRIATVGGDIAQGGNCPTG